MTSDDSTFVLRWEIENAATTLINKQASSPEWKRGGFTWSAKLDNSHGHANSTLLCGVDHGKRWMCDTEIEMAVLRVDGVCEHQGRFYFDELNSSMKHFSMIYWPKLMNPKFYNINNTVVVEFRIKIISKLEKYNLLNLPVIDLSKFHARIESNNVTLLIEDKRLIVSKEFLSAHSPVFDTMFFGNFAENGKPEVEIKDVEYEEFLALMLAIFPGRHFKISDGTVQPILKLADRFQVEDVIDEAEEFLVKKSNYSIVEKLQLADAYRLNHLQKDCLFGGFHDKLNGLNVYKDTPEFAKFSDDMKKAILDRLNYLGFK